MAKATFYNLPKEKKDMIIRALKEEFEEFPIFEASVSSIVKRAGIPRGSFYQYFESLETSFFTILELETLEVHDIFIDLVKTNKGNLFAALDQYGLIIAEEIFKKEKYNLYRNRYLYWTCDLDQKWKAFRRDNLRSDEDHSKHMGLASSPAEKEVMNYLSALIKKLIENLFIENWTKGEFLKTYNQYIYWFEHGLGKEEDLYGTF